MDSSLDDRLFLKIPRIDKAGTKEFAQLIGAEPVQPAFVHAQTAIGRQKQLEIALAIQKDRQQRAQRRTLSQ